MINNNQQNYYKKKQLINGTFCTVVPEYLHKKEYWNSIHAKHLYKHNKKPKCIYKLKCKE